jgi:hypothetical protein
LNRFIQRKLEKGLEKHAREWGCHWNRNIQKLISDANLNVVQFKRRYFGTIYFIVATPIKK